MAVHPCIELIPIKKNLLHGVKEGSDEDTDQVIIDVLQNNTEENINMQDIDRSHWLGKRKHDDNAPKPTVVKCSKYSVRSRK